MRTSGTSPVPTIIISMKEHPRCTTIDSDQYGCSRMVVDYLRERGHAHIRHLAGPEGSITADFRLRGWADALDAAGLERVEPLRGDWTADSGYELGVKLAQDKDMTALYVGNDQMAMGAMTALRIHGRRVPEDVSIVGVDDSLQGVVPHNTLTTVRFDLRERGKRTFDHFFAQMSRVPEDVSIVGVDDSLQGVVPHNTLTTVRFDLRERGKRTFDHFFAQMSGEERVEAVRLASGERGRSTTSSPRCRGRSASRRCVFRAQWSSAPRSR